eukprot:TRINITY_DN19849_c0_g1_i1.p1 TRINITY_DN19849_c0_g1~~TRINITY_DN19849_c0_g1_i1.p1  ORF type:complete len:157 (+),score=38.52 TRINITY_DN19849_c0_g1_i1:37-507(+)
MVDERTNLIEKEEKEESGYFDLDWDERIYVSFLWLCTAGLCTMLSWVSARQGRLGSFAVLTVLSCVFTVCSSCSMSGTKVTLSSLFTPSRRTATLLYLTSLFLLFIFGYYRTPDFLIMLTYLIFFFAQAWFTLSYIPLGHTTCASCCRTCCSLLPI